jgi:hypothetical protein
MNVDKNQFLITTSRNIQFTTVEKLDTKETQSLTKGIVKVINLYKRREMTVQTCLLDNEFECIRHSLMEMGVYLNVCAPHEHVPEIERKIRTVKERIRGTITMLPFRIIPTIMITHAVIFSTMWLNFFPPKGGVSLTLSPQAIVTGLSPDAERHCRIPFGGYAQVHVEASSSNDVMVSRTVGGISLGPTGNIQGTYKFMSLLTGKLIKARSFTPLPMPDDVISKVESMASGSDHLIQPERTDNGFNRNYIPVHEDDVSLRSEDYSGISTQELLEILEDDNVGNENMPEFIASYSINLNNQRN